MSGQGPLREERDAMGAIAVPAEALWGASTQRSLFYFSIGQDQLPAEMVRAMALIKFAAAEANAAQGRLAPSLAQAIEKACQEILEGRHPHQFPVSVWQTGSGTQFNMNLNEVIANRANQLLGSPLGSKDPVHPNDHVNQGQSSNDTFPSAMHIATVETWTHLLKPVLQHLHQTLRQKSVAFAEIVKIGRTHLQDAVPLTLGQEFSGYSAQIEADILRLDQACQALFELAIGGTAVGTGINCPPGFAQHVVQRIAEMTQLPFHLGANRFALLASHDAMVHFSGALRTLSCSLVKIASDLALLSSGPRCGIGELELPANEPGSSIMPGKVNPTQCEALSMVATQVMGLDAAVAIAGSRGVLELNVFKPLIASNVLQSLHLLADGCRSFVSYALIGLQANQSRIEKLMSQSLMLITALVPLIGYDHASAIAKDAYQNNLSLKEAALRSGQLTEEQFDHAIGALLQQTAQQGKSLLDSSASS